MAKSLLLNEQWDITLDNNGNLAWTPDKNAVNDNYAIAQNVACACRAFTQDMYFNQTDGIPHFDTDISNPQKINPALLIAAVRKEALKFQEVANATLRDIAFENRVMSAILEITLKTGEVLNVTI